MISVSPAFSLSTRIAGLRMLKAGILNVKANTLFKCENKYANTLFKRNSVPSSNLLA